MSREKVLTLLRAQEGYLSGEELSRELGLSRAAVWKAVEALRKDGYAIEARTGLGYRLTAAPDALTEREVRRFLGEPDILGRELHCLGTIDSTNTYAKKLAYYYITRVQQPVAVLVDELESWGHQVMLCNDSRTDCMVSYRITDGDTGEVYLKGECLSPANENVPIGHIREMAGRQKLYLITWEIDGKQYGNHYISGYPSYDAQQMLNWVEKIARLPDAFEWEI